MWREKKKHTKTKVMCLVDLMIMPGSSFRPLAGDSRGVSTEYTELGNPSAYMGDNVFVWVREGY